MERRRRTRRRRRRSNIFTFRLSPSGVGVCRVAFWRSCMSLLRAPLCGFPSDFDPNKVLTG